MSDEVLFWVGVALVCLSAIFASANILALFGILAGLVMMAFGLSGMFRNR